MNQQPTRSPFRGALAALIFLVSILGGHYSMSATPHPLPECRIEVESSYRAGAPVILRFSLRNPSDQSFFVLRWQTPLEGLLGRVFAIEREDWKVPYRGPMFKRADPTPEEYVEIPPQVAVSMVVDLATAYDLSEPGEYRVEFASQLHDVAVEESEVPRPRDRHEAVELDCNGVTVHILP
ncbi:MAG: protease [bacterium]|nr:protease [bacterium]